MKQRQAVLTVRLVLNENGTLDDAVNTVLEALTDAELMAHVQGERVEVLDKNGKVLEVTDE